MTVAKSAEALAVHCESLPIGREYRSVVTLRLRSAVTFRDRPALPASLAAAGRAVPALRPSARLLRLMISQPAGVWL
jgi:hypothetical protein